MKFEIQFIDVEYLEKRITEPGYRRPVYKVGVSALDAVRKKFYIRNWFRLIDISEVNEGAIMLPWRFSFTLTEEAARNIPALLALPSVQVRIGKCLRGFLGFNIRRDDGKYTFVEIASPQIVSAWAAAGYPENWGCDPENNEIT